MLLWRGSSNGSFPLCVTVGLQWHTHFLEVSQVNEYIDMYAHDKFGPVGPNAFEHCDLKHLHVWCQTRLAVTCQSLLRMAEPRLCCQSAIDGVHAPCI